MAKFIFRNNWDYWRCRCFKGNQTFQTKHYSTRFCTRMFSLRVLFKNANGKNDTKTKHKQCSNCCMHASSSSMQQLQKRFAFGTAHVHVLCSCHAFPAKKRCGYWNSKFLKCLGFARKVDFRCGLDAEDMVGSSTMVRWCGSVMRTKSSGLLPFSVTWLLISWTSLSSWFQLFISVGVASERTTSNIMLRLVAPQQHLQFQDFANR